MVHPTDDYYPRTTLAEDLLLLSAFPGDGRIRQPSQFRLALAGATLADLLAAGAVVLDRNRLVLVHRGPLGHPALDAAVTTLAGYAAPPRGARVRGCVSRLGRRGAGPYLQPLVERGFAQRRVWKLLGLIPITQYVLTPDQGAPARKARRESPSSPTPSTTPRRRPAHSNSPPSPTP
ncbi:GOLPH3/VPS74 family protein [Streptacidiphilus sp. PAMC 29251]